MPVLINLYNSSVYFIRDPFVPPARVKTKKPVHDDFLVLGAPCSLCNRAVCFDKGCSVFFGSNFCALCVARERRRFPDQVLEMLSKGVASNLKSEKS
ncbi:unnamed protein product [Caenorhabditis angaria]|uniref:Cysteine-rich DPF motif domain-containing protein 1 n=1 Tax=Caenorhabditis angaria TaxID=860376 RepID=A0A9P1I9Y7_9PELO|nr:unnamed protein product [Caenorhabditis angaria]